MTTTQWIIIVVGVLCIGFTLGLYVGSGLKMIEAEIELRGSEEEATDA